MAHVVVLGGGFGGLAAAHTLRTELPDTDVVTVVASRETFFIGFAKLWDLVGFRPLAEGSAPLANLERHGIRFVHAEVTAIDPHALAVETTAGPLGADGLIIALGATCAGGHLALLRGAGHNLYDAGALAGTRAALEQLREGRLLLSILGTPYQCPPAPYEAALLLDEALRARGDRQRIDVVVSTPQRMTMPAAGPDASRFLADTLAERGVRVLTEHSVAAVEDRTVRFAGGEAVAYDLLLGVPASTPLPLLSDGPLAGPSGWIQPDPSTFRTAFDRVYAVGDCTRVVTATAELPKAGVFAEGAGRVAALNLHRELHGGQPTGFDGVGHCFLELPGRRAARIGGSFYARPRPEVVLSDPDEATFQAKQRWERERLTAWLG